MNPEQTALLAWIAEQQSLMLERTITLSEVNSGSFNAAGVNRVGAMLAEWFAPLGASCERIPVAPLQAIAEDGSPIAHGLGDAVRMRKRPEAPIQIFFCGHLDTVFAEEHAFQKVRYLNENQINGPGVADLKGGLIVMLTALQALERSPYAGKIGWEVLLNPDEEIGSQSSMPLIEEAAKRCQFGMIYEPCMPNGDLAGARKGSGNFSLVARGRAAHAGREHHLGRNAIRALCDVMSEIDDLNGQREGITFNPGFIHGGGAVNVVPDMAMGRFNVRLLKMEDQQWCSDALATILDAVNQRDGIEVELHGGFTRPPKEMDASQLKFFELARECGATLGLDIKWHAVGGCCDGNNLAAFGVPNIDTLGVRGGKIHSDKEYMDIDSLTERAQLSAMILLRLAAEAN